MKDPHTIIIRPHITEKTVGLSYGNPSLGDDDIVRKYTFVVAPSANKIEIKQALEAIYNEGKKDDQKIVIEKVHTINLKGKTRRVGRHVGQRRGIKKAIVTLAKGQLLEDYGV